MTDVAKLRADLQTELDRLPTEDAASLYTVIVGLFHAIERERDEARAAIAKAKREALQEAAAHLMPSGKRPCDCSRCDCGNVGDAEAVAMYDASAFCAAAVRGLIDKSEP